MLFTIRKSSILFDITIVLIDFIIGTIGDAGFRKLIGGNPDSFTEIWVAIFVLFTTGLYITALIIFKEHLRSNIFLKVQDSDYAAMVYSTALVGTLMPMCFWVLWPNMPMPVYMSLFFIIIIGWLWIHIRTFNLANQPKTNQLNENNIRWKLLLMMLPFSAAALTPVDALGSLLKETMLSDPHTNIVTILFSVTFMSFILAFLAWTIAYLPRRLTKAALEMPSSGKLFFWFLVLDFALKVIPWPD